MASGKNVEIAVEHQLIILGQIGNLYARVKHLRMVLQGDDLLAYEEYLRGIEIEIEYLEKYFPPFDWDFPLSGKQKPEESE